MIRSSFKSPRITRILNYVNGPGLIDGSIEIVEDMKTTIDKLIYECVGSAMQVYNHLGPGLLEGVYEKALVYELKLRNLSVQSQKTVDVVYKNEIISSDLRLDIIVENAVIIELKSVESLQPVHFKQLRTYMKLIDKPAGILINFDVSDFSKGYRVLRR